MSRVTTSKNEVRFAGHNGRNSSRVLAPPGGHSSIFFSDPATPPRKSACQEKRGHSSTMDGWSNQSPIRKTTIIDPQNARATPLNQITAQPCAEHGVQKSNIFGEYKVASPIGKSRDVHTSSRVLAPPGGRCHNIFGWAQE
jgi:hypothetical protein